MTKVYETSQIRNIALLGHSGSGKTSLVETMLFDSGSTNRLGKVEEGNTVSDYDPEEIRRTISITASVIPVEWQEHKINVIDTPGYLDFVGEVISSLNAVDVAVVMVDGSSGVEVGTILAWKYAVANDVPRAIFVNKMERENASFRKVLTELRGKFEGTFVPMQLPIRDDDNKFVGVVDLLTMTAVDEKGESCDIPDSMADDIETFKIELVEAAAETDEELMMKYFDDEPLTNEEIASGIITGLQDGSLIPVLCGSVNLNIGVHMLMNVITSAFPAPNQAVQVIKGKDEEIELSPDASGPTVVKVFKTVDDQYGSVSYFKVISGVFKSDTRVMNIISESEERIGQLFLPRGKEQLTVSHVYAGDIGAVVKLNSTKTGDTLCIKGEKYQVPSAIYPDPLFAVTLHPKTQSDAGKIGAVLARVTNADPTLNSRNEPSTRELLLEGMGESHIDVIIRRMSDRYSLNVNVTQPKVPYVETITKIDNARYRHKKQTGGAGQFGEVELQLEPLERGAGFEFESKVFGGAVSSVYFPSVEKGIKQAMEGGILAGYPVVDIKAIIVDGKEHPVDSKDIAFQVAGREAFKKAFMTCNPVLLEPIMELIITIPETYTGDVISDMTTKRGQVQGMEQLKGDTIITVLAPLAEIQRYATQLRSITQGRGFYAQKLAYYQNVPKQLVQAIIDVNKKEEN
ncbi:MAG: elongation factor G [Anaerolineaceae bacterium 4572_78]|nr:MAG: elongation factor G [Anaerolineaceae bacterium 4572_78]